MWTSAKAILGFEVTFSAPEDFTGYAPYTHMFGSVTPIIEYSELLLSEEIRSVQMNFDEKTLREIIFLSEERENIAEIVSNSPIGEDDVTEYKV